MLTALLEADPALKATYRAYLELVARLTNPLVGDDLRSPAGTCFLPPFRSHEFDLVQRLYGNRPIPDGWSLADAMVTHIRDGSLILEPSEASGWYDLQTWALEPFVCLDRMAEGSRLRIDERYRRQLEELFKAIVSLTRETHVKQLQFGVVGAAMRSPEVLVYVRPALSVEPLPTYYERRAVGYAFVRQVLESAGCLSSMRRMTAAGQVACPLSEELDEITALFRGAAAVARHELGMQRATGPEAELFRAWTRSQDVTEDVRMMVPVFFDRERGQMKVWMILGWTTQPLAISFATRPTLQVLSGSADVRFGTAFESIANPVCGEAYVSRLLDRDEFRAVCDRYRTRTGILDHLAGRTTPPDPGTSSQKDSRPDNFRPERESSLPEWLKRLANLGRHGS